MIRAAAAWLLAQPCQGRASKAGLGLQRWKTRSGRRRMVKLPVPSENGAKSICGNTRQQNRPENRSMQAKSLPQEGFGSEPAVPKEGTAWREHIPAWHSQEEGAAFPGKSLEQGMLREPQQGCNSSWVCPSGVKGLGEGGDGAALAPCISPACLDFSWQGFCLELLRLPRVLQAVPQPWLWNSALPNPSDVAPPGGIRAGADARAGNGDIPSLSLPVPPGTAHQAPEDEHGFVPG